MAAKKRFTFADAKEKIKDLESKLAELDTSDNVYTHEENEMIKKALSVKSWLIFSLWSLIPGIIFKWAIWGSKRFYWAKAQAQAGLIVLAIYLILWWPKIKVFINY